MQRWGKSVHTTQVTKWWTALPKWVSHAGWWQTSTTTEMSCKLWSWYINHWYDQEKTTSLKLMIFHYRNSHCVEILPLRNKDMILAVVGISELLHDVNAIRFRKVPELQKFCWDPSIVRSRKLDPAGLQLSILMLDHKPELKNTWNIFLKIRRI